MPKTKIAWPTINIRYDDHGTRFYGSVRANGKTKAVEWYPSVTEVIRKTSPMAPGLLQWYSQHGFKEAERLKNEAAAKGTEMHTIFERYLDSITGEQPVALNDLPTFQAKALLSFDKFIHDNEVVALATERRVVNEKYKYAGTVDMVCNMNFNKQRIVAIVDYKSGSTVYEDYAIQLEMYRLAWNSQHKDTPVTHIFNWLPKDWNKAPTYTLKNQTGVISEKHIATRCALYQETNDAAPRQRFRFMGSLPCNGETCYEVIQPEDVIFEQYKALLSSELRAKFDKLTALYSVSA